MVNIRRRGGRLSVGGVVQQVSITPPPMPRRTVIRRNITDVVEEPKEAVEQMEMIDAPDQFIDTDNVNFIPIQSANGAIIATLF
jgi:hypothetical protein